MFTSAFRRLSRALLGVDAPVAPGPSDAVDTELRRRARVTGLVIGVVAVLALPAWSFLDLVMEPERADEFILVRLLCVALMLIGLWLLWAHSLGRRHPAPLTAAILTVAQVDIAWMVAQVDHVESYALGLSLALYGSGGILAAPMRWTAVLAGVTWVALIAAWLLAPVPAGDTASVAFYTGTATLISLITHGLRQSLAVRELRSRLEVERQQDRTRTLLERLDRLSHQDPLTGLANRRRWDAELAAACNRAAAMGTPLAVVLVDLDHFRQVNERYGHAGGDVALRAVAGLLAASVRDGDLVARLGGDELAVLLPGADAVRALELAEQLRRGAARLRPEGLVPGELTLSLGVAEMSADVTSPAELVARADKSLYSAKRTRNAVGPLTSPYRAKLNAGR